MSDVAEVLTPENIPEGGIHGVVEDGVFSPYENQELAGGIKGVVAGMLEQDGGYGVLRDIYSDHPDVNPPHKLRMWVVKNGLEALERLIDKHGADRIKVDKMVQGILRQHVLQSY